MSYKPHELSNKIVLTARKQLKQVTPNQIISHIKDLHKQYPKSDFSHDWSTADDQFRKLDFEELDQPFNELMKPRNDRNRPLPKWLSKTIDQNIKDDKSLKKSPLLWLKTLRPKVPYQDPRFEDNLYDQL